MISEEKIDAYDTTYHTIEATLKLSPSDMAVAFLGALLQTLLPTEPLLTNMEDKIGPEIRHMWPLPVHD